MAYLANGSVLKAAKSVHMRQEDFRTILKGAKTFAPNGDAGAKVLLFDIETSPIKGWTWDVWKQNISPVQIIEDPAILCFAAKWLHDDKVLFQKSKGHYLDDRELIETLATLFDQADIIVAHNGKAFDISRVWSRMIFHGLPPPVPFKVIDTCLMARSILNLPHNSLQGIARYYGLGSKMEHEGFPLWFKCMDGDTDAWERMEEYNIQDVLLMEEVYRKLAPYDKKHPNMALYYEDCADRCTKCGAKALVELNVTAKAAVSMYPSFRCKVCGSVCRSGSRIQIAPVMRNIL